MIRAMTNRRISGPWELRTARKSAAGDHPNFGRFYLACICTAKTAALTGVSWHPGFCHTLCGSLFLCASVAQGEFAIAALSAGSVHRCRSMKSNSDSATDDLKPAQG